MAELLNNDLDLKRIFISREHELDLFDMYLTRWKQQIQQAGSQADEGLQDVPTPNNLLQNLLVLLYGRGGFGKSTLLKHYRDIALETERHLLVSDIVDWESEAQGKLALFNPPAGQEVDASAYYHFLHSKLAKTLHKTPKDFKHYQATSSQVEAAKKQANTVLERLQLQNDDRYAELRGLTIDILSNLIGSFAPYPLNKIATNAQVKDTVKAGIKLAPELLAQVHAKLQAELGSKLAYYLDAATQLGLALGQDLNTFARNMPILIFFDTYEEVDNADLLLRIVMGAAGLRVGWVLAGRDNLWAGTEQRHRSLAKEYGYKEIISADRSLAIDFNVSGTGAFTSSAIQNYFGQVCTLAQYEPPLPSITAAQAEQIYEVTQGIPLAISIAANLYLETSDLELVLAEPDTKTQPGGRQRDIVEQMIERYLLHAQDDQNERRKIYGLALLRRADNPPAVAVAIGLSETEAKTEYDRELSRLHRRYSFIFTEKAQPSLHQEVRHFLRLWLLERCQEPNIMDLNTQLKTVHETHLQQLETDRQYPSLQDRLKDDEWVNVYLELAEQQFWLDPVIGVRVLLPCMLAAAIYRRDLNKDAAELGAFFAKRIPAPYCDWWQWASQGLTASTGRDSSTQALSGLQHLAQLAEERGIAFPIFVPESRNELEAALWWRLGEAYVGNNAEKAKALEWYEKALTRLSDNSNLRKAAADVAYNRAYELYEARKYAESLPILDRAIELNRNDVRVYYFRGSAYRNLKKYELAIADYTQIIKLEPNEAYAYDSRGRVYRSLKEYKSALADFNQAITLDPGDTYAYISRGLVYRKQKEYESAIFDFNNALTLDPNDALTYRNRGFTYLWLKNQSQASIDYHDACVHNPKDNFATWMAEWVTMGKQRIGCEVAERLEAIATRASDDEYIRYVCRSVALGVRGSLRKGLHSIEQAIQLKPEEWGAYFWKGMLAAYYYRGSRPRPIVEQAITKALEVGLPPILLTPLYWLEVDAPELYTQYAKPLLTKYEI